MRYVYYMPANLDTNMIECNVMVKGKHCQEFTGDKTVSTGKALTLRQTRGFFEFSQHPEETWENIPKRKNAKAATMRKVFAETSKLMHQI